MCKIKRVELSACFYYSLFKKRAAPLLKEAAPNLRTRKRLFFEITIAVAGLNEKQNYPCQQAQPDIHQMKALSEQLPDFHLR